MTLPHTPSQTVGPYYAIGLCRRAANVLDEDGRWLRGRLLDGEGAAVDGVVELWDAERRAFGRSGTDADGAFAFRVSRDARSLDAHVFARGLLRHLRTRIYLDEGDVDASVAPERRATLVARGDGDELRFDIHLQGELETVFFAV